MPLVVGRHVEINHWIDCQGGGLAAPTTYQCIGWYQKHPSNIVGGICFHSFNSVNCYANIALLLGVNPRGLIRAGLTYAFGQLALRRLTFFVSSTNLSSISFVEALGAIREATLSDAEPAGDLHIYALRPDSCPIWTRIRGKILLSSSRT